MSALLMMPKVIATLRRIAYPYGDYDLITDAPELARKMLAELAADGINVSAPPKVPEPRA